MSVLPTILHHTEDPLGEAFGCQLNSKETSRCQPNWMSSHVHNRHWSARCGKNKQHSAVNNSNDAKEGFQLRMDVQHFSPNEITVKTIDNSVIVEAKHEEKQDRHGHIFRHFVRRYEIPKEFDVPEVISSLSCDGVLTVKAPPKVNATEANERVVKIQHTGPAKWSQPGQTPIKTF